uniref:Uncharacterized protein n=1 Tax=Biomphalaria glabrata TaxID=6526 RepID=A0A2C9LF99_BIOGL
MDTTSEIERFIITFVQSKTEEKIYIDLSTEHVIHLKPVCARGSFSLGIFWVHVFQHPNNYPIYSHTYKKLYQAGGRFELQLRIEGVSISINLKTGWLTFQGTFVIDWFVRHMPKILEAYNGQHSEKITDIFTKEEMEILHKEKQRQYRKTIERWPENVLKPEAYVMEAGRQALYHEPIDEEGFLFGKELESYCPIPDLLTDKEIEQQFKRLEKGQVIQGHILYRLWLSTLNSWLSDQVKVYVFTPHMDCNSLVDLCKLFLKNKTTAHIETICVPLSNLYGRFAAVKSNAIKQFDEKDQVLIEYTVYGQIVYPVTDFSTSFIAAVKDGTANVLLTNTNFDRESFFTLTSVTVHYKELEERQFAKYFLEPILG